MTTPHTDDFQLAVTRPDPGTVLFRLGGDLDHDSADELLDAARGPLTAGPVPRVLVLDRARLTTCDPMGPAALLTAERIATGAGAALRLENRPAFLDRLLDVTGTSDVFAPAASAEPPASPDGGGTTPGGRGPTAVG